jgi:hypothetical protein
MPLYPKAAARLPAAMRPTPPVTEPQVELTSIEALERRQLTLQVYPDGQDRSHEEHE